MISIVYTVLDDTLCSFDQGTTSILPFIPNKAASEKRFIAVLGEIRLHRWSCTVVRHGGNVHRDVFCSLFSWFAASFFLLDFVHLFLWCLL